MALNHQCNQDFPEQSSAYFLYPTRPLFAASAMSDCVMGILSQVQEGVTTQVGDSIFGWRRLSLVPHKLYPAGSGLWPTPMGQHCAAHIM